MMIRLVHGVNALATSVVDWFYYPLGFLDPVWSLSILSLASGLLMLLIVGRFSDQKGIIEAKKRLQANLLAIRLFQRDPRVFLRIQIRILIGTLSYLRLWLKPMAFMILPFCLILIQLDSRYGSRPLVQGETAVVTVRLLENAAPERLSDIALKGAEGIAVETPPVRIPSRREVSWRIRAHREGNGHVTVTGGGEPMRKLIATGRTVRNVNAMRTIAHPWILLLNPGEAPIGAGSSIESVFIDYPSRIMEIFGMEIHWLLLFLIVSVGSVYLFKGFFKIEV